MEEQFNKGMEIVSKGTPWERFKEGLAMITPLESAQATQKGNWVMLIGLLCGIVVLFFKLSSYWWVELILFGGLFNQVVTMIGLQQKINMLKKMEEIE